VNRGTRIFNGVTIGAALSIFAVLGGIVVLLCIDAWPALRDAGASFWTEEQWFPDAATPRFGVAALVFGTLVSSAIAFVIALPVAVGTSLFVTELAGPRLARWTSWLIDLLAAVPSVVYGLWGFTVLVPFLEPIERWLDDWFGFIPLLHSPTGTYGRSLFAAGVILAVMILPIIAALTREVFRQVPRANREAALALGATRWEMIRTAVLPFGRRGVVAAAMLGLGRALGETIAVALVLAAAFDVNWHVFEPGGNSIAANIAVKFGEAGDGGRHALIASGLVLFVITLVVNVAARFVVRKRTV
jgi:phosphate transport system permease protein